MKNFSELLDTDQHLEIKIDQTTEHWPLTKPVALVIDRYQPVYIDDFLIEEHHGHWNNNLWTFNTQVPFYQWKHEVTGQGWLFYQNTKK